MYVYCTRKTNANYKCGQFMTRHMWMTRLNKLYFNLTSIPKFPINFKFRKWWLKLECQKQIIIFAQIVFGCIDVKYKSQKNYFPPAPLLTRYLRQCQGNRVRLSRVNATWVLLNTIRSFISCQFVFIFFL